MENVIAKVILFTGFLYFGRTSNDGAVTMIILIGSSLPVCSMKGVPHEWGI